MIIKGWECFKAVILGRVFIMMLDGSAICMTSVCSILLDELYR